MARIHGLEFHELAGFPAAWRDYLTDFMSFHATLFRPYHSAAPLLARALQRTGSTRIVDLCSGAGTPLLSLRTTLEAELGRPLEILLTDKYPNVEAFKALARNPGGGVKVALEPVDALDVPPDEKGFRTLFTAFHHFMPAEAKAILADAVDKGQGIGIFEYTERNLLLWALPLLLTPLFMWIVTPFLRPFRWSRLLWTYLLPVVPLAAVWDGLVSCLRTYSSADLQALVDSLGTTPYRWSLGRVASLGLTRVTYLIGTPEA